MTTTTITILMPAREYVVGISSAVAKMEFITKEDMMKSLTSSATFEFMCSLWKTQYPHTEGICVNFLVRKLTHMEKHNIQGDISSFDGQCCTLALLIALIEFGINLPNVEQFKQMLVTIRNEFVSYGLFYSNHAYVISTTVTIDDDWITIAPWVDTVCTISCVHSWGAEVVVGVDNVDNDVVMNIPGAADDVPPLLLVPKYTGNCTIGRTELLFHGIGIFDACPECHLRYSQHGDGSHSVNEVIVALIITNRKRSRDDDE
jgi:hypothetical protein